MIELCIFAYIIKKNARMSSEEERVTLAGRCKGHKPVHSFIITRDKTRSNAFPKELIEFGLKSMTILEICTPSKGRSPCKCWLLEAQPFCHHRVHSIASNQHLPFKNCYKNNV